jgi:hypothetical protein
MLFPLPTPLNPLGPLIVPLMTKLMENPLDLVWEMNSLLTGWKIPRPMTPLLGPFNNNLKLSKIKLLNQKLCNGEI